MGRALPALLLTLALLTPALAAEGWKAEFDSISAKTDAANELSVGELKKLVERCDALKPAIDGLDGPEKKVYGKRLAMCRDLFQYMVEAKEKEQPPAPAGGGK